MTRQVQQIILFSILALVSYSVWKYFFDREKTIQDKPFTKGYSIENVELKITDELGKLTAKFTSPNLTRFTDTPVLNIETPLFWTYKEGKEHWKLESISANYDTDKNEVDFTNKLKAQTVNDETPTKFVANNLLLDLNNKKANTKDGVNFIQQNMSMTGQIAKFDLDKETLEVSEDVKAIYKSQYKKNQ